jgi:hypothetical protein
LVAVRGCGEKNLNAEEHDHHPYPHDLTARAEREHDTDMTDAPIAAEPTPVRSRAATETSGDLEKRSVKTFALGRIITENVCVVKGYNSRRTSPGM